MQDDEDSTDDNAVSTPEHPYPVDEVRLDKWLWAARFFKTRSLSKEAIESGKVRYNGERAKVGRAVQPGAKLNLRQGWDELEVEVLALSDQRRGAPEAQLLYRETDVSRRKREQAALERAAANASMEPNDERPNKKQRRLIHRFKRGFQ